jgi:hypothetical protein
VINTGKCPGCGNTITSARFEAITINEGFTPTFKGVSFICPSCSCVLGVGLDPLALKAGIVKDVVESLRKDAS